MPPPSIRWVFISLFLTLLWPARLGASPESVESLQKASTEWVKTRAETARLESEWDSQRELLGSMVTALEERASKLEENRDQLKTKTAGDRKDLDTMRAGNQTVADGLQAADAQFKVISEELLALRRRLPTRLSAALEMSYRSLASSNLGSAERVQLIMTILSRCAEFKRTITYGEDILTPDEGGGEKSLEVIYWGLSHGYALDRAGGKAWFGSPGTQGWHWEAQPDAVRPVTQLISIFTGKAEPEFVAVPARLGSSRAEAPKQ